MDDLLPETKTSEDPIEPNLLKEYIRYAREKCRPELSEKYVNIIRQFYVKLRDESKSSGGMNVAVRHIESIIRVSTGKSISIQPTPRCTYAAKCWRRISTSASAAFWSPSSRLRNTASPIRFARTSATTSDLHSTYLLLTRHI